MKAAIMQPYFMPYLGYFALIDQADIFILFDTPQFIRHGWIERNRVLKTNGKTFYIKVPLVKHHQKTRINEIKIDNAINWKDKIFAQLTHYKKKAPYYQDVIILLEDIFKLETDSIVELNYTTLIKICNYLDIKTPIKIWSEMNIEIEDVNGPDEWALNICKVLGASVYYNPIGGKTFFDNQKYYKSSIDIKFLNIKPITYKQFDNDFQPFLSILDVLMFCSKKQVLQMLNQVEFID